MSKETKAPEVLVLELVHSAKSQFVMDGPGGEDMPDDTTAIRFPSKRNILTTSKVKFWNEKEQSWGLKPIRYIAGCDSIDPDEQERLGYRPNYLTDTIQFVHGRLTVIKTGADIGKYLFLKASSNNVNATNRADNAIDVFKEINTEVDAVHQEDAFDTQLRAMNYVAQLKTSGKSNESVYDENQIAFLCSLFKLPAFESGFKSEAWVALQTKAQSDPVDFLNKIGAVRGRFESDVAASVAKGLIHMDGLRAFFSETNKHILTFDSELNRDEQLFALTDHMSNPKNKVDYDHLRSLLDRSVNEEAGVVN